MGDHGCLALLLIVSLLVPRFSASQAQGQEREQTLGRVKQFQSEMSIKAGATLPPGAGGMPAGFRNHSAAAFVSFSAYRLAPSRFVVVGLGHMWGLTLGPEAVSLPAGEVVYEQKENMACSWTGAASGQAAPEGGVVTIPGSLRYTTPHEPHHAGTESYYPGLLFCDLDAASTGAGHGGSLEVRLGDATRFVAYQEDPSEEVKAAEEQAQGPFERTLVFCGPPMFGSLEPLSISQWVAYHKYYPQYDHFWLYDAGGVDEEVRRALGPFTSAGLVTVLDLRGVEAYHTWNHGQGMAMHDCVFRSRDTAAWVSFGDFDEYVVELFPPPVTLRGFLAQQLEELTPWLSYGLASFLPLCTKALWEDQNRFGVERALFRERLFNDIYRYVLIVNPRLMEVMKMHRVLVAKGSKQGFEMNRTTQLRAAHYSGIIGKGNWCQEALQERHCKDLIYSQEVAELAAVIRACFREGVPLGLCSATSSLRASEGAASSP